MPGPCEFWIQKSCWGVMLKWTEFSQLFLFLTLWKPCCWTCWGGFDTIYWPGDLFQCQCFPFLDLFRRGTVVIINLWVQYTSTFDQTKCSSAILDFSTRKNANWFLTLTLFIMEHWSWQNTTFYEVFTKNVQCINDNDWHYPRVEPMTNRAKQIVIHHSSLKSPLSSTFWGQWLDFSGFLSIWRYLCCRIDLMY